MTTESDRTADLDPMSVASKALDQREAAADAGASRAEQKPAPEEDLWAGRTDWKHFAGGIAAWAALSLIALIVSLAWLPDGWWLGTIGLIAVAGAVMAVRIAATVYSTRYRLTTERLFIERGLIGVTKDQTELIRVDDVRVRKLLVDRIFDLGTVEVLTTDQTDRSVAIAGVAAPDRVAELIRSNMRRARKKSLFIENL
ncbi:MAG: PH domain-containing protein [Phycisphaerae bacterium]